MSGPSSPDTRGDPPDDERRLFRCRRLIADAAAPARDDIGVLVEAGQVAAVEPWDVLASHLAAVPVILMEGVVLPGLVDAHSHLRGVPLAEQGVPDDELEIWLLRLRALTNLSAGDEALVGATDLVSTGVTSVQGVLHTREDPAAYSSRIAETAMALAGVGLRAELMIGLTDQAEWCPPGRMGVELARYLQVERGTDPVAFEQLVMDVRERWDSPLVRIGAAPVAPQWCSDATLSVMVRLVECGVRLHTHLLESPWQRTWLEQDPVGRLRRTGLLGPQLSVAHGVWLDDGELAELAAAGVTPVHCPSSNAGLQVGAAKVRRWLEAGLHPALGLDSHPQGGDVDVFEEMRFARKTAHAQGEPLTAEQTLAMATTGGARALGRSTEVGRIAVGFAADLVGVDLPVHGQLSVDAVGLVVDSARRDVVSDVVCAGRALVRDGRAHCHAVASSARGRLRRHLLDDASARAQRLRETAPYERKLLEDLRSVQPQAQQGATS